MRFILKLGLNKILELKSYLFLKNRKIEKYPAFIQGIFIK